MKDIIEEILQTLELGSQGHINMDNFGVLEVENRKPNLTRLFFRLPSDNSKKISLHEFSECKPEEAEFHPHKWDSEVAILEGAYVHKITHTNNLLENPYNDGFTNPIITHTLREGSTYTMDNPHLWHSVQPLMKTTTLMINGAPRKLYNAHCIGHTDETLKHVSDLAKKRLCVLFSEKLFNFYAYLK